MYYVLLLLLLLLLLLYLSAVSRSTTTGRRCCFEWSLDLRRRHRFINSTSPNSNSNLVSLSAYTTRTSHVDDLPASDDLSSSLTRLRSRQHEQVQPPTTFSIRNQQHNKICIIERLLRARWLVWRSVTALVTTSAKAELR